jgi:hypothetical protein
MYRTPDANAVGWRALATWLATPTPSAIDKVITIHADRDRKTYEHLKKGDRFLGRKSS